MATETNPMAGLANAAAAFVDRMRASRWAWAAPFVLFAGLAFAWVAPNLAASRELPAVSVFEFSTVDAGDLCADNTGGGLTFVGRALTLTPGRFGTVGYRLVAEGPHVAPGERLCIPASDLVGVSSVKFTETSAWVARVRPDHDEVRIDQMAVLWQGQFVTAATPSDGELAACLLDVVPSSNSAAEARAAAAACEHAG